MTSRGTLGSIFLKTCAGEVTATRTRNLWTDVEFRLLFLHSSHINIIGKGMHLSILRSAKGWSAFLNLFRLELVSEPFSHWISFHFSGNTCIKITIYTIIYIHLFYIFIIVHVVNVTYEYRECVLHSSLSISDKQIRHRQVLSTNQWKVFYTDVILTSLDTFPMVVIVLTKLLKSLL